MSRGRIVADGPLDEIRAKSGRVRYVVAIQESAEGASYRGKGAPPKKGEVEEALNKVTGVKKVGELPTDERAHSFELVSEEEVDLRPDLFKLMVDKGWVLLELHRDSQTLEDVFRSLTIGDERRNRTLGPVTDAAAGDDDENEDEEDDDDDDASQGASGEGTDTAAKVAKDGRS